ncbi:hypothetical protein [Chondromyces crocatus]|uniref:Uncharacterized protein n=1 Tax=Chondromyces crocatus TaxID=52 RepID=A0A0K1E8Y2_CHOCO|nr:hypothetical protein [Chondromyces crocatus]AKT37341.1 uncharacterized protein CMC5_014740 [Chondromyces crocatus]
MRDRVEFRAKEPIARCLIRRLVVPRIYFDAPWPKDESPLYDVLAIDRDGNGDAHVVQVRKMAGDALAEVPALLSVGAPFRWIAFLQGTQDEKAALALVSKELLYAKGSAGRVGVIEIVTMSGGDLGANVVVTAERFPGSFYDLSTAFSGSHKADIQY